MNREAAKQQKIEDSTSLLCCFAVKEYLFESLLVRIYHYRHSPVYVEYHLKPLLFNLKLHDVCYLIARTPQVEHVFLYLKLVVLKSGNVKGVFDYAL